ncbi:hypothetical protein P389DRAFT_169890 [Cystobasidium minutum MCA 4210]|uniref:uncharacterized protein n=1 Tax=Cystobasidium minutum MCA 4210 TaxID=1397322 RepID=UPI0034CE947A|eukprot:jgi/Rhomi1/169890/fgenesh1_kg.3_\
MKLLPVKEAISTAKTYIIPAYKDFPNSSLHNLPLIIYRPFAVGNGSGTLDPAEVERLLEGNDLTPAWRYGMYPFNHYHSNTHEILVPYKGSAKLAFGHDSSPDCIHHTAVPGDVYILPAGIAHRSLEQSNDFQMVGSYPAGSHDWDNCKGSHNEEEKKKLWNSVSQLGRKENWLKMDPIYGDTGESPLRSFWK